MEGLNTAFWRPPRLVGSARATDPPLRVGRAALFAGLAGAETVTRGQVGADASCSTPGDFVVAQTGVSGGTSYRVPAGQWTITSWKAQGGLGPGQEALVVFRATGTPDEYTIVGSTAAHTLSAPLNTFSADIDVEGGDLIGLWVEQDTICARATGSSSDTLAGFFPAGLPGAGATFNMFTFTDYRLNVSVELKRSGRSSGGGSSSDSSPLAPEPEPARIAVCPRDRSSERTGRPAHSQTSSPPSTRLRIRPRPTTAPFRRNTPRGSGSPATTCPATQTPAIALTRRESEHRRARRQPGRRPTSTTRRRLIRGPV